MGQIGNKTADGLLHEALNKRIISLKDIFPKATQYMDQDTAQIQDPQKIQVDTADQVITPNITSYLAQMNEKDSSALASMGGGGLMEVLRIFRDLQYLEQDRRARLLNGYRGLLLRAKTNKLTGRAFL